VTTPTGAALEVHVIEDHPLYGAALARTVADLPGVTVATVTRAVEEFAAYRPRSGGVVILDLTLPGVRGAAAVLRVTDLGFRVLVVSADSGPSEVLAAIAAGARGYLTKDADADEIRRALREVSAGNSYVSPTLASFLLDSSRRRHEPIRVPLSERERQVLALVAAGERDHDIAKALTISVRTVRSHLDRIRDKTGRRRRPDLTRLAIEEGIGHRPSIVDPIR